MRSFGFVQSQVDTCLFHHASDRGILVLFVYVDDLLIAGTLETLISELKTSLNQDFTIKDLGYAKYFMGLKVARSHVGIFVNQKRYTMDIISEVGMTQGKEANTPLPSVLQLQEDEGVLLDDPTVFRRLIGRLLYLNFTRLDIMYVVHHLSQFIHQPRKPHWAATLHVQYLKHTSSVGLFILANKLEAYCDADWATCKKTRRSITRYCVFLGNTPIS